jgi:uncharacterized membrane protein
MKGTKKPGESFRDYFRRAQRDPAVRRQILESSRTARSISGWGAVAFAILAVWRTLSLGMNSGGWVSTQSVAYAIFFVLTMMVYSKFGERIASLQAMDRAGKSKR